MVESENKSDVKGCFSGKYHTLPFPVIVTDLQTRILYKNHAAAKRFPLARSGAALGRLSGYVPREGVLSLEEIYGERFFVSTSTLSAHGKVYYAVFFLESFFAKEEKLAQLILENSEYLFRELSSLNAVSYSGDPTQFKKAYAHVMARQKAVREEEGIYLRFLRQTDRREAGVYSCSLYNLLTKLGEKLREASLSLSVSCPKTALAMINLKDFAFVLLNVVQFVNLYSGDEKIAVKVEEREGELSVSIPFEDRDHFILQYLRLVQKGADRKSFSMAIAFTPLLCAVAVCKKYKIPLRVTEKERGGEVEMILKSNSLLPDAFLSAFSLDAEKELSEAVREIFFLS